MDRQDIYAKLKERGIALPNVGAPAAAYAMCVQSGDVAYLSGHLAKKDGQVWVGKLGATLTTEEGSAAAWRESAPNRPRSFHWLFKEKFSWVHSVCGIG